MQTKPSRDECLFHSLVPGQIFSYIKCGRRRLLFAEQDKAYPILYTTPGIGPSSVVLSELDTMKEWIGLFVYRATGKIDELFPAP
jgi:hypothetical protein